MLSIYLIILFLSCVFCKLNDFVDSEIYNVVDKVIDKNYPEKTDELRDCYAANIRKNKIVEKFYTADLLYKPNDLWKNLKPYMKTVEDDCEDSLTNKFIKISGIILLCILILLGILVLLGIFIRNRVM